MMKKENDGAPKREHLKKGITITTMRDKE